VGGNNMGRFKLFLFMIFFFVYFGIYLSKYIVS
jgi:hypothetical protein